MYEELCCQKFSVNQLPPLKKEASTLGWHNNQFGSALFI
ncbi:hypothetical protein O23A_p1249 [Aeromonas salmonicida]|nr:hypothetical protein O23A_p1249 [Aeromonas salmonicida]